MPSDGRANLVPGAGAGNDGTRALKSGWRTRRPPAEVLEPHLREVEADPLLVDHLEQALALDKLIVTRISEFLERRGWDDRGRKMRPEVEYLSKATDRLARRAEQLRKARLDAALARRAGLGVDLATAFAEEEGDDG